jgi:Protein of unknown function (DUF3717)
MNISQLEQAINRARETLPPEGKALILSPDVAQLASIYGQMIFEHKTETDQLTLSDEQMLVIKRWA